MIGIFAQTQVGFVWLANVDTLEESKAQIDAGDFDGPDVEFVFAIEGVVHTRNLEEVEQP